MGRKLNEDNYFELIDTYERFKSQGLPDNTLMMKVIKNAL